MPAARPLVNVYHGTTGQVVGKPIALPTVFTTPIRSDLVHFVHFNLAKNKRQAHGISTKSGHQTAAESWGTGRAVSRIPRVPGGGTHRAGQGAFANMCRGGRVFAPSVIWRRWHRKVNITLKRHAMCAALAASAVPALVTACGHRITHIPEVPLVVDADNIHSIKKTKEAVALLKKLHAHEDVTKVTRSKKIRAGRGKWRNRRYTQRRGPLVIYKRQSHMVEAFRNIAGVDLCCVTRMNLLQLAPGGHLGRFIIWTKDAFAALNGIFGQYTIGKQTIQKGNYHLPRPVMANTNIRRIVQAGNVKFCLRPRYKNILYQRKRNPLRNFKAMLKLNPNAEHTRRATILYNNRLARFKRGQSIRRAHAQKKQRIAKHVPAKAAAAAELKKKAMLKAKEKRHKHAAAVKKDKAAAKTKKIEYRGKYTVTKHTSKAKANKRERKAFNKRHPGEKRQFLKFLLA